MVLDDENMGLYWYVWTQNSLLNFKWTYRGLVLGSMLCSNYPIFGYFINVGWYGSRRFCNLWFHDATSKRGKLSPTKIIIARKCSILIFAWEYRIFHYLGLLFLSQIYWIRTRQHWTFDLWFFLKDKLVFFSFPCDCIESA